RLRERLGLYLERAGKPNIPGRPVALVSPHAGFRFSGQAAAYGFKALSGKRIRRVVVLGLSHRVPYRGASVPDVTHYETPLGKIPVDVSAVRRLREHPLFENRPEVHRSEHSIEMQLPFLQAVLGNQFKLIPITFGSLEKGDYRAAADAIRKILDQDTLIVASSDFMHFGRRFGYRPFERSIPAGIEASDRQAIAAILSKNFDSFYGYHRRTGTTICGRVPIGVLLNLLGDSAKGRLLRYYRSGDMTGEWDGSVSYASILFTEGGGKGPLEFVGSERKTREEAMLDPKAQSAVLALARATVESFVRGGKAPDPDKLSAEVRKGLQVERGVFVTLRKHGHLRGCIGSIVGVEPLYKGVVGNAINSCAYDRRFKPVKPDELKDITVEVSVLSPLRRVSDWRRILPGWHGVVLRKGNRRSVFLPHVALEFNWEIEETLSRLAVKAGMPPDAWKSGAEFSVFEAQIIPE
ncbi:MAG: AmmeMemoRadiSam system protein B, partial [Elusimicrobiota bacterium]